MLALPVLLVLVISVTPGISPRRRSSGAAMLAAMVSGSAPGRPAKTTMVGMSTLGSGATGRKRTATRPVSSSPMASRKVATGRWMNGAEIFIVGCSADCSLSLRERAGVTGSWLRRGALPAPKETGPVMGECGA